MTKQNEDIIFMKQALDLAQQAKKQEEVPVGAIIVYKNKILASAFNKKEELQIATAHAEILAIEEASKKLKNWRLNGCTLYVTLEPCPMCAAAILSARLYRLVYACTDPKSGGAPLYKIPQDPRLNHYVQVDTGILQTESSKLLKDFFNQTRKTKKSKY